jgi:hypothetical protein
MSRVPIALRVVLLLAGLGLVLLPQHLHLVPVLLTVVGLNVAVAFPSRGGSLVLFGAFLLSWTSATGWHSTPSVWRTVLAVLAVYVVHVTSALAAFVPVEARVDRGVLVRYLRGTVPAVLAAAVLVAADLLIPRAHGSAVIELVGAVALAAVVVGVVAAIRLG